MAKSNKPAEVVEESITNDAPASIAEIVDPATDGDPDRVKADPATNGDTPSPSSLGETWLAARAAAEKAEAHFAVALQAKLAINGRFVVAGGRMWTFRTRKGRIEEVEPIA